VPSQDQEPAADEQTPSAEPMSVPVRQVPLHQPQSSSVVQAAQVPCAAHGSVVPPPPPVLPPPPPVPLDVQTPPLHDRPAQQSADEVQAICATPHDARHRVVDVLGEPRQ
jgi:hypothetical protein